MDIMKKLEARGATIVAYKSTQMGNSPLTEQIEIIYDNVKWLIIAVRNNDGSGTFRVLYANSGKQIAEVYSVEDLVDLFN